jgi:hypothetical protein
MRLSICFRGYCAMIDVTTVIDHCVVARELTATASRVAMDSSKSFHKLSMACILISGTNL